MGAFHDCASVVAKEREPTLWLVFAILIRHVHVCECCLCTSSKQSKLRLVFEACSVPSAFLCKFISFLGMNFFRSITAVDFCLII